MRTIGSFLFPLVLLAVLSLSCGTGLRNLFSDSGAFSSDSSVILWLRFLESVGATTFSDSSNNSSNAVCGGTTCPTVTTEGAFGALQFDGVDDYIEIPTVSSVNFGSAFTVRFLMRSSTSLPTGHSGLVGLLDHGYFQIYLDTETGSLSFSQTNATNTNSLGYDSVQEQVMSLMKFKNFLYLGESNTGDIYICDPSLAGTTDACDNTAGDWSLSFNGAGVFFESFAVYNNRLYAGQGHLGGQGDIYYCDPTANGDTDKCDNADWTISLNRSDDRFAALIVFRDRIYAGQGDSAGDGDIYMCDPALAGDTAHCDNAADWSRVLDTAAERIHAFAEFRGKLYAGQGDSGTLGDLLVCDPTLNGNVNVCEAADWSVAYDGGTERIHSLTVYNGRLYLGLGDVTGTGDILMCNEAAGGDAETCDNVADFSTALDLTDQRVATLTTYNGKLFAGQGQNAVGDGDVYVCDPTLGGDTQHCDNVADWSLYFASTREITNALGFYQGRLYGAEGLTGGLQFGDVRMFATGSETSFTGVNWGTDLHHIVLVYDGTRISLYRNGSLVSTQSIGALVKNNLPLWIGKAHGAPFASFTDGPFNGKLSELVVLSKAATAEEVASDYSNFQ